MYWQYIVLSSGTWHFKACFNTLGRTVLAEICMYYISKNNADTKLQNLLLCDEPNLGSFQKTIDNSYLLLGGINQLTSLMSTSVILVLNNSLL